jgi:hypothetical protein
MSYKIVNRKNRPLCAFHPNGGWEIRDVFPCIHRSYIIFDTPEEAQGYIDYIIRTCEKQRARWGAWTEKALKFARALRVL